MLGVGLAIPLLTVKQTYLHKKVYWDIVMAGGRGSLYRFSPGNPYTTQKDISEWDIVMSVSILTYKKTHNPT